MINVYDSEKELENSHDGTGFIKKKRAYNSTDFSTNIDFIDYIEVPPGTSIGIHQHEDNEEIYFIIEGTGTMFGAEGTSSIKGGDVIVNPINGIHGLKNTSQAFIKIFIFQVSK